MGPKGRHSYSTATNLRVIDYARLRYNDGGLVGNRGAATGLGTGLCPRLTFVRFAVVARNMTNPHSRREVSYEKHAFACFGNSSISHTQKTSRPRGVYPEK